MSVQLACWTFWTYVAGQNGDISPHRVRSVGSILSWTYVAGQKGGSARSTFVLRQSILSMLGAQLFFWHFSAPSPVCRLYLRPGRMLRAKKVTFLGTAPGLRLSYVSPSSVCWAHSSFFGRMLRRGWLSRHAWSTFVLRLLLLLLLLLSMMLLLSLLLLLWILWILWMVLVLLLLLLLLLLWILWMCWCCGVGAVRGGNLKK